MAPRANWRGHLKVAELSCPVALYTAASTSDRISFRTVNRETGNRVRRQFVDEVTGDVVENDDQVKGYEIGKEEYVVLTPDEISTAVPASNKTLTVQSFIPCDQIDSVYFDKPYYLRPGDEVSEKVYDVLRESMRKTKVAALARTVLFRRCRTVLIRSYECGLVANTLNFDYEVRSAKEAFSDIRDVTIEGEMLDLAKHIIQKKKGRFDPGKFDDRYEEAVAEVVKAKIEGREVRAPERPADREKVVDLMEALRMSAKAAGGSARAGKSVGSKSAGKSASGGKSKTAGKSADAGKSQGGGKSAGSRSAGSRKSASSRRKAG